LNFGAYLGFHRYRLGFLRGRFAAGTGGLSYIPANCSGIGLGSLAAHWKSSDVPHAAVSPDFFEPLNILQNFLAQSALYFKIAFNIP